MKKFIIKHLCLALLLSIGCLSCAQNKSTVEIKDDEKLIEFTTDRFTLPNLHVTPDGQNIIFDVLGDIYQVPIEGGKAKVLLQDNNWKRAGKLSPDGKVLAYVSDETGVFQVWTMDLETKEKRSYPIIESVHYPLYAYWKDKRRILIPSKEGLQSFDVVTEEGQIIRPALEEERSILHAVNKTMSANKPGNYVYFQKSGDLWAYDVGKNANLFIGSIPDKAFVESIKGSNNGEKVVFYKKKKGDNSKQDLMNWDLSTNNLEVLNTTKTLGFSISLNYSFDFIDDDTIILDKEGEVVRMDINTGEYKPIPIEVEVKKVIKKPLRRDPQSIKDSIITASVLRNPVTRKDLDTIYFGAFGKLHGYAKTSQTITEICPNQDRFEVSPSLSPDGKYLAYTTWNDIEMGHLFVRDMERGKEYQLTETPGRYINPAWSPDGTELVFVSDETEAKMGVPRQSGGTNTFNYYLDIHRISVDHQGRVITAKKLDVIRRITPISIVPRRFYPIPVYHPSGNSIYISTRNKENDLPTLIEIDLISKEIINELLIPFHTDEVLISPDAKHIAFIYDEQVWIDSFPFKLKMKFNENSEFISKERHYKGGYVSNILIPEARFIYQEAPSYLFWQDKHTLMWGSAKEVYTYDVRIGKTEKIADIKVQKPRAVPKTQYALTNARIITMNKEDEIIEQGTILVKDNRIEDIGKMVDIVIPESYTSLNLEGRTIMPGFIDVHAHFHHFPYEFQVQQNYKYIGNLAYGVTSIYDPSVNVLDYREQAQMVEVGDLLGPRVFASGNIIFNFEKNYDFRQISSKYDTDRIIKSNQKLRASGPLKQYDRKNRKHRQWLNASAKEYGMTLTNHETNFVLAMSQLIDGYTAMDHEKYTFPIQKDIVELIAQSGINYTPTFIVSPGIGHLFVNESLNQKEKLKRLIHELVYQNYYAKHEFDAENLSEWYKKDLERNKVQISNSSRILKDIVDAGGKVSVGGHGNPLPGIGTHWELWSFIYDNGLTKYEALKAATINGAEKLDLQEEIGSIEENKLVDLVVLNSNPLESIFNSTDILYTIQNGIIYDAETLRQIYPLEK